MLNYTFPIDTPLTYCWCGKFKAPSTEWIHMTRPLEEYELFLVTEGTLYIANATQQYTVHKGEYLFMAPTTKQYGYKPSYCAFHWLHFSLSPQELPVDKQLSLPLQHSIPNLERIIILIHQLQDADRRYHHSYMQDMLVTGILLELYNQIGSIQKGSASSSRYQLYQSILDYIRWNKLDRILVTDLAEYFNYHEKYLSSFFKSMAGISLKQFLLQEKMEHAKAELMDTNKTISQIAYSIGFPDGHNFSHAFKKVTGITPTEYRISCLKLPKTP